MRRNASSGMAWGSPGTCRWAYCDHVNVIPFRQLQWMSGYDTYYYNLVDFCCSFLLKCDPYQPFVFHESFMGKRMPQFTRHNSKWKRNSISHTIYFLKVYELICTTSYIAKYCEKVMLIVQDDGSCMRTVTSHQELTYVMCSD